MSEVMVTLDLDVKPEVIEPMCEGLPAMIADTKTRPGFIEIRIVRLPGTNRVLFVERWASEQAYNDYIAWRTERGDMDGFAAGLNSPPQITIWPVTVVAA
jgi:quinol monooxygenase YgiN